MAKPPAIEGADRFVGRGLPAITIGARAFASSFADGRLVVMPRTAHDLPASAVRDYVSGFLDEDTGPTVV